MSKRPTEPGVPTEGRELSGSVRGGGRGANR